MPDNGGDALMKNLARTACVSLLLVIAIGVSATAQTEISTRHLDVKAYPSQAAVAPGTRFTLGVEFTPKNGIHVYAPGASKYRVVSLTVAPQPHVRLGAVRYPKSEIYHFVPLNERVPTFQKPFTLVMDVVPEATPEGRKAFAGTTELVLTGILEYQACDDRICYNPVSLPLTWTVEMKPMR